MALAEESGFDAVDDGSLDASWRQQPGTPCYGAYMRAGKPLTQFAAVVAIPHSDTAGKRFVQGPLSLDLRRATLRTAGPRCGGRQHKNDFGPAPQLRFHLHDAAV